MSFLKNMVSSAVNLALTPVSIVEDVVDAVVIDNNNGKCKTKKRLEKSFDKALNALTDLLDGEI